MSTKFKFWIVAAFLVIAIVVPFLFLGFTVKDKYVISVFRIKNPANQTIVVGDKEDIYFKSLDSNKLSVFYDDQAKPVSWKLKKPEYLKINNTTINKYRIDKEGEKVSLKDNNRVYSFDLSLIKKLFAGVEYKYISCKDYFFIEKKNDEFTESLKSIISNEKGDSISLILLDSIPININNGPDIYPAVSGKFLNDNQAHKFSFFKTTRTEFYDTISQKNDYTLKLNDTVSVRTTVSAKYTNWGAASLFFETNGVYFDKPVINAILKEDINKTQNKNAKVKQINQANFLNDDYYIPSFSKRQISLGEINDRSFLSSKVITKDFDGEITYFSYSKVTGYILCANIFTLLMLLLYALFFRHKSLKSNSSFFKQFSIYDNQEGYNETKGFKYLIYLVFGTLFFLGVTRCYIGFHLNYTSPYYYQYFYSSLIISLLITCSVSIFIGILILSNQNLSKITNPVVLFIIFFVLIPLCVAITALIVYYKILFTSLISFKFSDYIQFKGDAMERITNNRQILAISYLMFGLLVFMFLVRPFKPLWRLVSKIFKTDNIFKKYSIPILMGCFGVIIALILPIVFHDNSVISTRALGMLMLIYSFIILIRGYFAYFINNGKKSKFKKIALSSINFLSNPKFIYWIAVGLFCILLLSNLFKLIDFSWKISGWVLVFQLLVLAAKYLGEKNVYYSSEKFNHLRISEKKYKWQRFRFVIYNMADSLYHTLPLLLIGFGWLLLFPLLKSDSGYVINIIFPFTILFVIISFLYAFNYKTSLGDNFRFSNHTINLLNNRKAWIMSFITSALFAWAIYSMMSFQYRPFNRFESRLTAFFSFNKIEEDGTTKAEEQAQFFSVLAKNVEGQRDFNKYTYSRILSQPGTGVMHNDLSYPAAIVSPLGNWNILFTLFYLALLFTLLLWVIKLTVAPNKYYQQGSNALLHPVLTTSGIVRIIAAGMLAGNAVWLLASYYNIVPFTGRLMYGMGQDSVGEALDTIILFSLLLLTYKKPYDQIRIKSSV